MALLASRTKILTTTSKPVLVVHTDTPVQGADGYTHPPGVKYASYLDEWEPIVDSGLKEGTMSYEELMTSLVSKETVT